MKAIVNSAFMAAWGELVVVVKLMLWTPPFALGAHIARVLFLVIVNNVLYCGPFGLIHTVIIH